MQEVDLFELFDTQKCSELAKRIGEIKSQPVRELRKLMPWMEFKPEVMDLNPIQAWILFIIA